MATNKRRSTRPLARDEQPAEELVPPVAGCVCPTCELARAEALADRARTWAPREKARIDFNPFTWRTE